MSELLADGVRQRRRCFFPAQEIQTDMWTLSFLIILSLALGLAAWLFFLWSVKSGQYDDTERPKHRMLEEDEEDEGRKEN
jgi:cbb3-type cytochrome oxidase maturation protein